MSISVQCPLCQVRRRVNERLAGRTIRCPGCDQPLAIPTLIEAEPDDPTGHRASEGAAEVSQDAADASEAVVEAIPVATTQPPAAAASSSAEHPAGAASAAREGAAVEPHHAEHPPSALLHDEEEDVMPQRKKREDDELDMTPMVDVTFLLLIFFMVTASFSLQKSIQMPKQNSDLPSMSNVDEPTEELDPVELEIEENGSFLVLAAEWERETPGKQNLVTALKQAIGANKDGMRLDIKVHENAQLQMLVDGMDAGTIAGFEEIQVAEVDGFD